jgi:hypothetical protein
LAPLFGSVLELHGTQEGGEYNAHYHTFGHHAGWALDVRTDKIAALWLNEGNANTALAHHVLADLRDLLPKIEKPAKARVGHRPAFLPDPWAHGPISGER